MYVYVFLCAHFVLYKSIYFKVFLDSMVAVRLHTSCFIALTTAQNSHLLKEKEVKFK